MGYRHTREEIVEAAAAVALEGGMAALTYRRVADRLGISDRMVVYYLPTKADLVTAAAVALSASLQGLLDEAFGDERRDPDDLMRAAWPHLTAPRADGPFRAFFEIVGLAAAGVTPYDQLAPALLTAWSDWLVGRTAGTNPAARRRAALGVIARLDGLLLIRHTLGPAAAEDAARALGIVPGRRQR